MNIKPLFDRIVVKRTEEATTTKGGIIIPDTAKEKPAEGTVVAVGDGRMTEKGDRIPMDIHVGDRVLFSKYGGNEVKIGGDEYLIMGQDDVYAIVGE